VVDAIEDHEHGAVVKRQDDTGGQYPRRRDLGDPVQGEDVEKEAEEIGGVESFAASKTRDNDERPSQRKPGQESEPIRIEG
jgi:hypothetical protein